MTLSLIFHCQIGRKQEPMAALPRGPTFLSAVLGVAFGEKQKKVISFGWARVFAPQPGKSWNDILVLVNLIWEIFISEKSHLCWQEPGRMDY